jgi:hypothetical protein
MGMKTTQTIQFTSIAATLPVRPAAQTVVQGASVAQMTAAQASIALAIQGALRGSR